MAEHCNTPGCKKPIEINWSCKKHYWAHVYLKRKEQHRAYMKQWNVDNKEHVKQRASAYYEKNKELNKERCKEYRAQYTPKNRGKLNSYNSKRRAKKLNATPKWVTNKELKQIEAFYTACPSGFNVDHYYPLQGIHVSGLHVLSNLRYLSNSDNSKKNNKTPGIDWPEESKRQNK
jgi:hypothetical protein